MKLITVRTELEKHTTPLLALSCFEGAEGVPEPLRAIDQALDGQLAEIFERGDFKARTGDTLLVYPRKGKMGAERLLLVGLGKAESIDAERVRRAAGTAVKRAAQLGVDRLSVAFRSGSGAGLLDPESIGQALAEGAVLGAYRFDEFKSAREDEDPPRTRVQNVELLETDAGAAEAIERGARIGTALAEGENLARTLGNLPGNVATPSYLAEQALEISRAYGMKATILGPEELRAEGMEALLAVAQGSQQEPRLIVLEHRKGPAGSRPLVFVGKGLTFDSGGISIKPAAGMEEMKFDMCGGAAVLGAMRAIGELQIPLDIVAIVPSSENLPSGTALKPGDIIGTHLGRTIEVVNTDAEGRLILADALSYAQRFEPAAIIDAATLTGACVIALGHHASAALGNDEALLEEVRQAGVKAGERAWPLPMFDEYREQLKSDYADLKNTGGRAGGAITAAWFLREFVGDTPWVHLDVAGTAFGDGKLSYQVKGATGAPTRLFLEWVLARAA